MQSSVIVRREDVVKHNAGVVAWLLGHNVDVRCDRYRYAAGYDSSIVSLLRALEASSHPADPTCCLFCGWQELTLLHICRSHEVARLLLEQGAVLDAKSKPGWTPLHHAIAGQNKEQVELFIHAGADVNYRSNSGCTALHCAVQRPSVEVVDMLIKAGANINSHTNAGTTPLHLALGSQWPGNSSSKGEIVTLLLKAGADVNARNAAGKTALDLYSHRDLSLVMSLLEAGVDPKEQHFTFLEAVCPRPSMTGHLEVAQWLIDRSYDINSGREVAKRWREGEQDARGCNALLSLAAHGPDNPERLAFLLNNGADMGTFGEEALRLAVEKDNPMLARGLREAGVQPPRRR